jgi:hypothetical protein
VSGSRNYLKSLQLLLSYPLTTLKLHQKLMHHTKARALWARAYINLYLLVLRTFIADLHPHAAFAQKLFFH